MVFPHYLRNPANIRYRIGRDDLLGHGICHTLATQIPHPVTIDNDELQQILYRQLTLGRSRMMRLTRALPSGRASSPASYTLLIAARQRSAIGGVEALLLRIRFERGGLLEQGLLAVDPAHQGTPDAIGRTVDGNIQVGLDIFNHHIG